MTGRAMTELCWHHLFNWKQQFHFKNDNQSGNGDRQHVAISSALQWFSGFDFATNAATLEVMMSWEYQRFTSGGSKQATTAVRHEPHWGNSVMLPTAVATQWMMPPTQIHNLYGDNQLAVTRASSAMAQNNSNRIVTVGAVTLALQLLLPCFNNNDWTVEIAITSGILNIVMQHDNKMIAPVALLQRVMVFGEIRKQQSTSGNSKQAALDAEWCGPVALRLQQLWSCSKKLC